jgi:hypothetical protein
MSQRVPHTVVPCKQFCKPSYTASYTAAWSRLVFALLLPLSWPPFAGKSALLAESWMHSSCGALILAVGQGNRPLGGRHDGPADILTKPEIDIGSGRHRARARPTLRQSGWSCRPGEQHNLHTGGSAGDARIHRAGGVARLASLQVRSRAVFAGSCADVGIILACEPDPLWSRAIARCVPGPARGASKRCKFFCSRGTPMSEKKHEERREGNGRSL